jgi:hypothetical protein
VNGIAQLRSLLGRNKEPRYIEHGEWAGQNGRSRVLIENPDAAELWAHADILRRAGYDVATCAGPSPDAEQAPWFRRRPSNGEEQHATPRTFCTLLAQGHCSLVEGADVVVSTTRLGEGRELFAALRVRGAPRLVVEGTTSALERDSDVIGDATIAEPVTPTLLLAAVTDALSPPA